MCSWRKRRRLEEEADGKKRKMLDEPKGKEEGENSVHEGDDEEEESDCDTTKRQTSYYCKTCSEEPGLCPVPCFELYHTQLIYKTTLETQGEPLSVSVQ